MEEQAEETLSEKTISDDEFDPNKLVDIREDEDEDEDDEWESVSQILRASTSTSLSEQSKNVSSVWIYFDKNPVDAPGYNVCKSCSKKYQSSTSVTVLRNHFSAHQLKAPTRAEKNEKKLTTLLVNENNKSIINILFSG